MRHAAPAPAGLTHASSVIPPARSSDAASATVTQSSTPSNDSARPKRPSATRVAPLTVPWLPRPDASATCAPFASSKLQAPTSPGGPPCATYVARYVAAVAGAVSACVWAPPSDQPAKP